MATKKKKTTTVGKRQPGTRPLTGTQKTWLKRETAKRKKETGGKIYKKPTAAEARAATKKKRK